MGENCACSMASNRPVAFGYALAWRYASVSEGHVGRVPEKWRRVAADKAIIQ